MGSNWMSMWAEQKLVRSRPKIVWVGEEWWTGLAKYGEAELRVGVFEISMSSEQIYLCLHSAHTLWLYARNSAISWPLGSSRTGDECCNGWLMSRREASQCHLKTEMVQSIPLTEEVIRSSWEKAGRWCRAAAKQWVWSNITEAHTRCDYVQQYWCTAQWQCALWSFSQTCQVGNAFLYCCVVFMIVSK